MHFVDGFSSLAYVGTSTLVQEGLLDYFHMSILPESIGLGYGLKILAPRQHPLNSLVHSIIPGFINETTDAFR